MIELKKYNMFPNTVFINGKVIPKQVCEDPIIEGDFLKVKIITDDRLRDSPNVKEIPYQLKPFQIIDKGTDDSIEVTMLFLDKSKIK